MGGWDENWSLGYWLGGVERVQMFQDIDRWRALVNILMNLLFLAPQSVLVSQLVTLINTKYIISNNSFFLRQIHGKKNIINDCGSLITAYLWRRYAKHFTRSKNWRHVIEKVLGKNLEWMFAVKESYLFLQLQNCYYSSQLQKCSLCPRISTKEFQQYK
jgi:hypothetical protein